MTLAGKTPLNPLPARRATKANEQKYVLEYQRRCHRNYISSLGLGADYRFLHGNPILPVVPIDAAQNDLFIIGAYPSARFAVIKGINDVPVDNNLGPFSEEIYFDGSRVRITASANELRELVLDPLRLPRSDCWITDLVKIFLFKPGHVEKYRKLGVDPLPPANRDHFEEYASASLPWLEEELKLAKPRLVLTLGTEVAGILRGITGTRARNSLLTGEPSHLAVGGLTVNAAHIPHPGILMRGGKRNPWPEKYQHEILPRLKATFDRFKENDQKIVSEFVRAVRSEKALTVVVNTVDWDDPGTPKPKWQVACELPVDSSEEDTEKTKLTILSDSRFFNICTECSERNPIGWMHDGSICQSCAEQNHGVVH